MNDAVNLSSVNDIASVCSGYGDDDVFDAFSHNALHITVSGTVFTTRISEQKRHRNDELIVFLFFLCALLSQVINIR